MRYLQVIIFAAIFNLPGFCQDSNQSIYDYILNKYLPDRVQTKSYYIIQQLIPYSEVYSLIRLDSINDIVNSELLKSISGIECSQRRLTPNKFGFKAINQSHFNKIFKRITVENGLTYNDPISNWKSFQRKYPDCQAIVSLSCPLPSMTSTEFVIYIECYEPTKKGFGDLVQFNKVENAWTPIKETNLIKPLMEKIIIGD